MNAMTGAANERAQDALRVLGEQEDYLRGLHYLTDEEMVGRMSERLRDEKAAIGSWLDVGDCFILAASGKIHLPECPSMLRFVDRDLAWAPYLDHPETVRDWHGSNQGPAMPQMLGRADVESLRRYSACPVCAPTLDHTGKGSETKGWTKLKVSSLKAHHFGRRFILEDGTEIGTLVQVATLQTAAGLDFKAEFDASSSPVTDPDTVVFYRPGTA